MQPVSWKIKYFGIWLLDALKGNLSPPFEKTWLVIKMSHIFWGFKLFDSLKITFFIGFTAQYFVTFFIEHPVCIHITQFMFNKIITLLEFQWYQRCHLILVVLLVKFSQKLQNCFPTHRRKHLSNVVNAVILTERKSELWVSSFQME